MIPKTLWLQVVVVLALLDGSLAGWSRIMRPHPGLRGHWESPGSDGQGKRDIGLIPRQLLQGVEHGEKDCESPRN